MSSLYRLISAALHVSTARRVAAVFAITLSAAFLPIGSLEAESAATETVLYTPTEELPYYDMTWQELPKRYRWRRKIHGIRMTALHPDVWTIRLIDRTDNRVLIPIRPFFLKASERENFRLKRVTVELSFPPATPEDAAANYSTRAPVLDIGFGGAFRLLGHGRRAAVDRNYAARISGFARAPSGILYRSHRRSVYLSTNAPVLVETGRTHMVELLVFPERAVMKIDGNAFAEAAGKEMNRGLVSLTSDWHPVTLHRLEVEGTLREPDGLRPVVYSGLVPTE